MKKKKHRMTSKTAKMFHSLIVVYSIVKQINVGRTNSNVDKTARVTKHYSLSLISFVPPHFYEFGSSRHRPLCEKKVPLK